MRDLLRRNVPGALWLPAVMGLVAILLAIYAGTQWKHAAGLAAAALAGGAVTRTVDVLRERSTERRNHAEHDRRQELDGIDQCRQLMATVAAGQYSNYTAATLTNALLNHPDHRALLDDDDVFALNAWKESRYSTDHTQTGSPPPRDVEKTFGRIETRMDARAQELRT